MNYFILNPLPALVSSSVFYPEGICLSACCYLAAEPWQSPLMHMDADFLLFGPVCNALKCKAINAQVMPIFAPGSA